MRYGKISSATLTSLAAAIRNKNGSADKMYPSEMAQAIRDFPIDSGATAISLKSFCEVDSFPSATLSDSLTRYVESSAFVACTSLRSVNLPACSYVGSYAFGSCYNITSVSLPVCSHVGSRAFYDCYNITSVYLMNSSVVSLDYSAHIEFISTPIVGYWNSSYYHGAESQYGSIYVPASLLSAYQADSKWSTISERIVGI